jgi:hypothetical protein
MGADERGWEWIVVLGARLSLPILRIEDRSDLACQLPESVESQKN